jgi:hypothetical protein
MPRKNTGSTTARSKKAAGSLEPIVQQTVPVERAHEDVQKTVAAPPVAAHKNGSNGANIGANIDEEIRYRAYELYLERNGAAGDPNSDWFVAEREVRARHATAGHSA